MAKVKRTDMQLKISGIPQAWITQKLELELEKKEDVSIEIVRELKWREKQKVVVKRVRGGVLIKDWKNR